MAYLKNLASVLVMLMAVPGARDMGVTLTHDAAGRQSPAHHRTKPAQLTMAAKTGRRNQSTGPCNHLWDESEMGLQRKIHTGI